MRSSIHRFVAHRPLAFVAALTGLLVASTGLLLGLARLVAPSAPVAVLALPLTLVQTLIPVALLTALGWWREAGFTAPSRWRQPHVYAFPVALGLLPVLVLGIGAPEPARLAPLVVLTLVIGFQEEALFRGLALRAMLPAGALPAALVSAASFGAVHVASLLVGRDPAFVAGQVVASAIGGFGLAALRLRSGTLWPLIGLHAWNDLVQFVALNGVEAASVPGWFPLAKVGIALVVGLYGVFLLRHELRPAAGGRRSALAGMGAPAPAGAGQPARGA